MNRKGQATTELVLLLPLFLILAGAAISIAYICWQGIKVQQAANYAARIQGQERVGGGNSADSINTQNGLDFGGDDDPSAYTPEQLLSHSPQKRQPGAGSVFGEYYDAVTQMFHPNEKLYIPEPHLGINTDRVKVVRVLKPPKFFGVDLKPIVLEAVAYGGEDSRMYGLPRWGKTRQTGDTPFYQTQIKD